MKTTRRNRLLVLAGRGLALLSGCQTWVPEAGITVPSGYYLRHPLWALRYLFTRLSMKL